MCVSLLSSLFSLLIFISLHICRSLSIPVTVCLSPCDVVLCWCCVVDIIVCECMCGVCGVVFVLWCWCTLEKPPCVDSKRPRVYRQHVHMSKTCGRVAGTHGDVLNRHTEACWELQPHCRSR